MATPPSRCDAAMVVLRSMVACGLLGGCALRPVLPDAGDGGANCSAPQDCPPPNVCDLASNQCAVCTPANASACTGPTPVCGTDDACRACEAHDECASSACLDDGSCPSETDVAYVSDSGVDNATCSKLSPCLHVMTALLTQRPYVKLHGHLDEAVRVHCGRVVTFLAD